MTRREALTCLTGAALAAPAEVVVETHVHMFSRDLKRFPPHPFGTKAGVAPLEDYVAFAREAGIAHSTHVSAEPYQDDMRYLEYTLERAPRGFLKGTILFDSIGEDTPRRMETIVKRHPGRIVALRVHCTRGRNEPATTGGMHRDRDLLHAKAHAVWKKAADLDIAIQAHIQPYFSPQVEKMGRQFPDTRIILDHFGHAGVGGAVKTAGGWAHAKAEPGYKDPSEFDQVLRLARLPQVILKVSALQYSSRQPFPHTDIRPYARRAFEAFGPDRMIWGSLGSTLAAFREKAQVFDANFDFLSAADRAKIRGLTARRLYRF